MNILLSILAATAVQAAPARALIGGGGSQPEAEAWLRTFSNALADPAFAALVTLAEGFPRVVESDSVPGLKPGLQIVLLGFCPAEEADLAVASLRMLDGGVYGRATTGALAAKSCPVVKPFPTAAWEAAATLELGTSRLSAWAHESREYGLRRELLLRVVKEGVLVDAVRLPPSGDGTAIEARCAPEVSTARDGAALVVEQSCHLQMTGNAAYCGAESSATMAYSLDKQGRLRRKVSGAKQSATECGGE